MNKVKVAVIGAGYFGERHARVYSESLLADLISVVDINLKRAKEVANTYGAKSYYGSIDEMLDNEDVDAVSIVVPEQKHKEATVACACRGKHILLEKPIAHTMKDAIEITNVAKKNKVKLMIGYLLRFDPRYAEGKKQINDGKIGEIISIWARRATRIIVPKRVASWSNPLFYNAVHDIDLINWYVKSEAKEVYAKASSKIFKEEKVPEVIHALISFKNDVVASLEINWTRPVNWPYSIESRLHVSGTKGTLYIDILDQGINTFTKDGHICLDTIHWPVINNRLIGDLKEEITSFLECIILDKEPLVTAEDGIKSLKIALAIMDSLKKDRVIRLN